MSQDDLRRAFALIERAGARADFEGAKSEGLVGLAEERLGVTFPPSLRAFLRRFGCGGVAGREFYGIIREDFENSGVPDAVWITLEERRSSGLPFHLVIVYATGDGAYFAVDRSSVDEEGESPVVLWIPGESTPESKLEVVASDYGRFLRNTLEGALGA